MCITTAGKNEATGWDHTLSRLGPYFEFVRPSMICFSILMQLAARRWVSKLRTARPYRLQVCITNPNMPLEPLAACRAALFPNLRATADLLMMPKEALTNGAIRAEMLPGLGLGRVVRLLQRFSPDDFAEEPLPMGDALLQSAERVARAWRELTNICVPWSRRRLVSLCRPAWRAGEPGGGGGAQA